MADLTEALRLAHEAQPDPPAARLLALALRRAGVRARLALYGTLQRCGDGTRRRLLGARPEED